MRAWWNDFFRAIIGYALRASGGILHLVFRFQAWRHGSVQKRLRRRYRVETDTPVRGFGPEQQLEVKAAHAGRSVRMARTSGSTSVPKELPYSKRRLRITAWQFVDAFARAFFFLRPRRTGLFIFSSPVKDQSLTTFLLDAREPSYLAALQAPYRLIETPAFRSLKEIYGLDALRFFLLVLTNPGVVYATNPSSLLVFFEKLEKDWTRTTCLFREYHANPASFPLHTRRAIARIASRGFQDRIAMVAGRDSMPPLSETVPGLEIYSCWTGGYVNPFLTALEKYFSGCRLLPMYSMSTETVETRSDFRGQDAAFLPMGLGVYYEFIEEGLPDAPENLGTQLEAGKTYTMVVSDAYGLKRYQTGDLFLCRGFRYGLPDLRFQRRRDLEYSFTGEKVTARQLEALYASLGAGLITCIPSSPRNERPHYKILLVGGEPAKPEFLEELASRAEAGLAQMNEEYRAKVESQRLNPLRCEQISFEELVKRTSGLEQAPAQFKLLPLYQKLWENP